jgi:hypothetical protein
MYHFRVPPFVGCLIKNVAADVLKKVCGGRAFCRVGNTVKPLLALVRYRLPFLMTVAGACDRAEREIADMENRISGAAHVIIDRVADV